MVEFLYALKIARHPRFGITVATKLGAILLVLILVRSIYYEWKPVSNQRLSPAKHQDRLIQHRDRRVHNLERISHQTPLTGMIWPRSFREEQDRIRKQIDYMESYRKRKGTQLTGMKIILKVGTFNFDDWVNGQTTYTQNNCPVDRCFHVDNESYARVADALLISEFDWKSRHRYYPKPAHQIWIAQHWESPMYNRIDPQSVRGLINWTASYRRDSTIVVNYGQFEPVTRLDGSARSAEGQQQQQQQQQQQRQQQQQQQQQHHRVDTINYAEGKTRLVAWFVSNCKAGNNRLEYALELVNHIQVDVYGKCGNMTCDRFEHNANCVRLLKEDYKFYLAFENSNCKDYITEKLTDTAFNNNVLPIVMGARKEDYAARVPAGSYIHVDDFNSPRDLALYLHELDKNDTKYNEYFRWKGTVEMIDLKYWCRLCMLLHLQADDGYVHWYEDYRRWWNGVCTPKPMP